MIRWITVSVLLLSMFPVSTHAAGLDGDPARIDVSDLAVDKALSVALARDGVAQIEITLDLTEKRATDPDHPAVGSDVHPAVFDIAMMADAGPMQLDPAGDFHLLRIAATEAAVAKILDMAEVVTVSLDTEPAAKSGSEKGDTSTLCTPSSTQACIHDNLWGLTCRYGGTTCKVAEVGDASATFWAYSSDNWEVLAKILNGCGINGHWWLMAAAAGTNGYSVNTLLFLPPDLVFPGVFGANNAPIINTTLYPCS